MTVDGTVAPGQGTLVRFSGASEAGRVRAVNQDSYFVGEIAGRGVLAIVADGMGGHQTGEVASQKAIDIVRRELARGRSQPPAAIAKAVQKANGEIFDHAAEHSEHQGMGTTLTIVLLDDQVGIVAHVGDSRAYLIRDGAIRPLTEDHSWVAERVRQGVLSEDEAKRHRWRNVITNALGAAEQIKLDLLHFEVRSGDRIFVCSDGVSMLVAEDVIARTLSEQPPDEAVKTLLELANERGSPDNITAVVLEAVTVAPAPKRYELPEMPTAPASVKIDGSMSGIRQVEEAFPKRDMFTKVRRKSWYPYRFWILGCLYLVLLFLIFSLR